MDKTEAEMVWNYIEKLHKLFNESIAGLDDYYRGNSIENVSDLLCYWHQGLNSAYLSSKPLLCDDVILDIIDNCIEADLKVKHILKATIEEDKYYLNSPVPAAIGENEMNKMTQCILKAREQGLIDSGFTMIVTLTKLTDFLVSNGFVNNRNGGWKGKFCEDGRKYFEEKENKGEEYREFIRQCLWDLDWKDFDNVFKKGAQEIGENTLRKAFSDHRQEKAGEAIRNLYYLIKPQKSK